MSENEKHCTRMVPNQAYASHNMNGKFHASATLRLARVYSCQRQRKNLQSKRFADSRSSPKKRMKKTRKGNISITEAFDRYGGDGGSLGPQGIQALFHDLHIDPSSILALSLMKELGVGKMGFIDRAQFISSCNNEHISGIRELEAFSDSLAKKLDDDDFLKQVYRFTFDYCREDLQQKTLAVEVAISLWEIFFPTDNQPNIYPVFINFLNQNHELYKIITKDQWNSFYEFVKSWTRHEDYDESGSWPVLFDEFVAWLKANKT